MDILKILSETRIMDLDPASDKEEDGRSYSVIQTKKSGRTVIKKKEISIDADIDEIIELKPPKKIIIKFLERRIRELLDSDSE